MAVTAAGIVVVVVVAQAVSACLQLQVFHFVSMVDVFEALTLADQDYFYYQRPFEGETDEI